MSLGLYRLRGHEVEPVYSIMEWARWFGTAERGVAYTVIGEVVVSTVFLGSDMNYFGGEPLLFETMMIRPESHIGDVVQRRYSTWDEAEAGHADTVERVRTHLASIERAADDALAGIKETK